MHRISHADAVAAGIRSTRRRPEVSRQEDLVWPPPDNDLQAFCVVRVGDGEERPVSFPTIAAVAPPAPPQPKVTAAVPGRTAPPSRPAPARARARPAVTWPHRQGSPSLSGFLRWMWVAIAR